MVLAVEFFDGGMLTTKEEHGSTETDEESMDPAILHEQLVKHVLEVSGELDSRSDVWGEHSYARARGAACNSQIRVLLPPPEPEPDVDDFVDVEAEPRMPPVPPLDGEPGAEACDDVDEPEDDEWEERLVELAPTAALRRLAAAALGALRDLRLERLATRGGRWAKREGAVAAARRLRRALAPHWAGGASCGAAWLHASLLAALPPSLAPLYAEVSAELRRKLPRLTERLSAPRESLSPPDPLAVVGEPRSASAPGPWLAWAPSGNPAEDERWVRRLGALLHTRRLRAPLPAAAPAPPASPAPPDRWCAALAHEARGALADVLADAGRRPVVVCGAGAGAALAAWLAGGARGAGAVRARALMLLAPPLLTAEGPRDLPEDILEEVEVPLLAVVGGGAAQCWRGAAAELACRGEVGGAARRVLLVSGADDALRLPRALRRRLQLPQHALDAAVAEESARWALEVSEAPEPTPRDRTRRKGTLANLGMLESEDLRVPPAGNRSIEIIEGRVVQRGVAGGAGDVALAAADIMQLPIVFADDDPSAPSAAPTPAPREGAGGRRAGRGGGEFRYTRVIVAKRPPARPVLLRRRKTPSPS